MSVLVSSRARGDPAVPHFAFAPGKPYMGCSLHEGESMANPEHLAMLKQGVEVWNRWRAEHPMIEPDLTGAILTGTDLAQASLTKANLRRAMLAQADLTQADLGETYLEGTFLTGANLTRAYLGKATLVMADLARATLVHADLMGADLTGANLADANLSDAALIQADLTGTDLTDANLREAILSRATLADATLVRATLQSAILVETNLERADLTGCQVYGISAWNLNLVEVQQSDLVITHGDEPVITVDNLEVAQFIYLLLHNEKIRHVIDTITSKVVLILGRFTPKRKAVLDAIRDKLRRHDLLPVLFDFQKPDSRSFIETVSTLAHMARFVIADMTEPRIVLQEVPHIVQNIAVPLVPLLLEGEEEPVTLYDLRHNHPSVLPTCRYTDRDDLLASLEQKVIAPAQAKAQELREIR